MRRAAASRFRQTGSPGIPEKSATRPTRRFGHRLGIGVEQVHGPASRAGAFRRRAGRAADSLRGRSGADEDGSGGSSPDRPAPGFRRRGPGLDAAGGRPQDHGSLDGVEPELRRTGLPDVRKDPRRDPAPGDLHLAVAHDGAAAVEDDQGRRA